MVITSLISSSALSLQASDQFSGCCRKLEVVISVPKISLCHHAEGRKTRRVVFLGPLILTTCPEGKLDGHWAKAPHQYVLRSQHTLDVDGAGFLWVPLWDCVTVSYLKED